MLHHHRSLHTYDRCHIPLHLLLCTYQILFCTVISCSVLIPFHILHPRTCLLLILFSNFHSYVCIRAIDFKVGPLGALSHIWTRDLTFCIQTPLGHLLKVLEELYPDIQKADSIPHEKVTFAHFIYMPYVSVALYPCSAW